MQNLSKVYENVNENQKLKNEIEKSKKQFEFKPFVAEFYELKNIAYFAQFFFSFFSIGTGFFLLYSQISTTLGTWLGALFAVVILFIIELVKSKIGTIFFVRAYKYGLQLTNLVLLFMFVCTIAISVFLSVFGAKELYKELDNKEKTHTNLYQIKKDSINKYFDVQIKNEKKELSDFQKSVTWQGQINVYDKTISNTLQTKNDLIKGLQIQKNKSINELDRQGTNKLTNINESSNFNLLFWLVISAINEILIVLCVWFLAYFNYKVSKESTLFDVLNEPKFVLSANDMHKHFSNVLLNTNEIATKANENYTLNTIANETKSTNSVGFVIGAKHTDNAPVMHPDNGPVKSAGFNTDICLNCEKEYQRKTHTQKYCSEACRIDFWQKEKNKKLFFKSKS